MDVQNQEPNIFRQAADGFAKMFKPRLSAVERAEAQARAASDGKTTLADFKKVVSWATIFFSIIPFAFITYFLTKEIMNLGVEYLPSLLAAAFFAIAIEILYVWLGFITFNLFLFGGGFYSLGKALAGFGGLIAVAGGFYLSVTMSTEGLALYRQKFATEANQSSPTPLIDTDQTTEQVNGGLAIKWKGKTTETGQKIAQNATAALAEQQRQRTIILENQTAEAAEKKQHRNIAASLLARLGGVSEVVLLLLTLITSLIKFEYVQMQKPPKPKKTSASTPTGTTTTLLPNPTAITGTTILGCENTSETPTLRRQIGFVQYEGEGVNTEITAGATTPLSEPKMPQNAPYQTVIGVNTVITEENLTPFYAGVLALIKRKKQDVNTYICHLADPQRVYSNTVNTLKERILEFDSIFEYHAQNMPSAFVKDVRLWRVSKIDTLNFDATEGQENG